ncbi:alpha/beta hydrolase [Kitasatospora sp. NPDC048540]|uniref:alpha/beta hydrolase n=1 Tax=Kitasatospora sp. NPDC048540 TaxID=3155634 RepID=UPI0033FC69E0
MTTTPAPARPAGSWHPAPGVTPRGTLLLLPGRGEHPGVYARFGRRLAFDGYTVHALADRADGDGLSARVAEARTAPGPVVLAGSDTGALRALAAAGQARPDALLLAAPPATEPGPAAQDGTPDWSDELAARTACPVHRGLLAEDPGFRPGRLALAVPADLAGAARAAAPDLPVLLLHGDADPVAPPAGARRLAARLPGAELLLVAGGLHDVLNDAAHRTVAAQIVQWLERLRLGPDLPRLLIHVPPSAPQEGTRP